MHRRSSASPGAWFDRLPHFRLDHTPSAGEELQSEYFVGREHAVAAFDAIDGLRDRIDPLVLVSEIRTIAADDLWLSPAFRRPSVAFHFTWRPDWPSVRALLPVIEAALEPFEPRPHWAKLFTMAPDVVRSRYERLPAFAAMADRFDPAGHVPQRLHASLRVRRGAPLGVAPPGTRAHLGPRFTCMAPEASRSVMVAPACSTLDGVWSAVRNAAS